MGVILMKFLIFLVVAIGCNDHTASFTQDVDEAQPQPLRPPGPVDAEGLGHSGGQPLVINDEKRDELKIKPDSALAGLTRTFKANPSHSGVVSVDFRHTTVDSTLEMTTEVFGESRQFTQLVRPTYTSRFKQTGTQGEAIAESFTQDEKGILDILMVVDNSGSMKEAQDNVAQGLPALLGHVSGSNWHIAVISTDRRDCIRRIITSEMADYKQLFATTIEELGIKGARAEEAILMAHRGLQGECRGQTTSWLREHSSVAIVIVTDEDHQCYRDMSYNKEGKALVKLCHSKKDIYTKQVADFYQPIDAFYSYLRQLRVPGVSAKIYGIINPIDEDTSGGYWLKLGSKWWRGWRSEDGRKLFDQRADIFSDRAGYDTILQNISSDISVILKDQFMLEREPSAGTVVVKVTTDDVSKELQPDDYMVKENVLTLNHKPPQGAVIDVQYAYDAEPDVKEFSLPQLPLPGSVSIEIDDNGQVTTADPSSYMRVGQQIKFHSAPPKGAELTISYQENRQLRTELQLGKGIITELTVTVDDEVVDTYSLDALTNLITFNADALPAEGAVVKAVYNAVLEENLSYLVARHDALRDDDNILCFSADDPLLGISCAWQHVEGKDYVVFGAGEFVAGRTVIVRQLLDIDTNNIQLQEHYLPETIKLQIGTEVCYASDLVIKSNTIMLDEHLAQSLCPHLSSDQKITLNYDYIDLRQKFSVEQAFFDAHPHEYEHWEIAINGERVASKDFKVTNHSVEFGFRLPADAVVEVKISLY